MLTFALSSFKVSDVQCLMEVFCSFQHTINSNNASKTRIKENKNKQLVLNDLNGHCLLNNIVLNELFPFVKTWKSSIS